MDQLELYKLKSDMIHIDKLEQFEDTRQTASVVSSNNNRIKTFVGPAYLLPPKARTDRLDHNGASLNSMGTSSISSSVYGGSQIFMRDRRIGQNGELPESLAKFQKAPEIDDVIKNCIDSIWDKYDDDDSGYLDKQECFKFIMESFLAVSPDADAADGDASKIDNNSHLKEQFEYFYQKVDVDGSGAVTKNEMLQFIKNMIEI